MDKLGIAESTYIKWIMKIKKDTIELRITSEDLKGKTEKLQILKDKCTTWTTMLNK